MGTQIGNQAEMVKNQQVIDKIKEVINATNSQLAHYEAIKKFELIDTEWTIEAGELTPKLSLKRKQLLLKHKDLVDKIYGKDVL